MANTLDQNVQTELQELAKLYVKFAREDHDQDGQSEEFKQVQKYNRERIKAIRSQLHPTIDPSSVTDFYIQEISYLTESRGHKSVIILDVEGEDCPLCLEEMKEGEETKAMAACMHRFHRQCLETWDELRCPFCVIYNTRFN